MKKLIARILLLVLIVSGIQNIIYYLKRSSDFPELTLVNEHLQKQVDLIYFGDSSVGASAHDDTDKRPLNEILNEQLSDVTIGGVHHAAYQMDLFLAFCKNIINKSYKPKYILIPINLRSFSADWDKRPEYQFVKEMNYLEDRWYSPFYNGIRVFDRDSSMLSYNEFIKLPVYDGDSIIGKVKNFTGQEYENITEIHTKNKIQFHYFNSIDTQHQKIKSMIGLCELFKTENVSLIFYVTPVDFEIGEKYFPAKFTNRIKSNIDVLNSVTEKYNCSLIDASQLLASNEFSWKQDKYPNEHMNQKGKRKLAKYLSEHISKIR